MSKVAILMGSDSDLDVMKQAVLVLKRFEVEYEVHVLSAHRTPDLVTQFTQSAPENGVDVFIAGAGGAAHLAGVIAAHTILPVIGVPVANGPLKGQDALYSTVQMPKGIPVATVGIDQAWNAGLLAIQILSQKEPALKERLLAYKEEMVQGVISKKKSVEGI